MNLTDEQRISKTAKPLPFNAEEIAREQRRLRALTIRGDLRWKIEDSLARRVRMERVKA